MFQHKMGTKVAGCILGLGASFTLRPSASAEVLKDQTAEVNPPPAVIDHFVDPEIAWSSAAAVRIVGNGENLRKIGIVWGKAGMMADGGIEINGGSSDELQFLFRFFPDARFSLEALRSVPEEPAWRAVFAVPSGAGQSQKVGEFLGMELFYSEVDVGYLGLTTVAGDEHLVALVPLSKAATPTTITFIGTSVGGEGTIGTLPDWYEAGSSLAVAPPGPLPTSAGLTLAQGQFAAARVTSAHAADLNADGHVNSDDVALFQQCASGPGIAVAEPMVCGVADLDKDGDVDQSDFGALQRCLSGPSVPEKDCAK